MDRKKNVALIRKKKCYSKNTKALYDFVLKRMNGPTVLAWSILRPNTKKL